MAYNNGFPVGYNQLYPPINQYIPPQAPQMQQQMMMQQSQEQTGPIWVQGEAGAKSYGYINFTVFREKSQTLFS